MLYAWCPWCELSFPADVNTWPHTRCGRCQKWILVYEREMAFGSESPWAPNEEGPATAISKASRTNFPTDEWRSWAFRRVLHDLSAWTDWLVYVSDLGDKVYAYRPDMGRFWVPKINDTDPEKDFRATISIAPSCGGPPRKRTIASLQASVKKKKPPGNVARHLNGQETDDRYFNVQWGTQGQNMEDMHKHRKLPSTKPVRVRISAELARAIRARTGAKRKAQLDVAVETALRTLFPCPRS